ncbi:hypothetical protein [Parasphingopyxis marina]|uniref:Uncharacterized protein n=1 Tax=Parasphingopyxis marina TaxID=2761622 RepID=A0A842HUC1_9SPHN|nr:hypothetical protein [Parasphingopyxis marina]MBC2777568.1 hypothetical protein [Parasphingopyxis marina]
MGNERLARALTRIEDAAARLDRAAAPAAAPAGDKAEAALAAEIDALRAAHSSEIEDRDRTIAKLRADLDDIGKLKDEEIARLRAELAERPAGLPASGIDEAEYKALQQRCERLESATKSALSGLDTLIATAEAQNHG